MALLHWNTTPDSALAQAAAVPPWADPPARAMAEALAARLSESAATRHLRVLAIAATLLWTEFLKFDAADPHWPDRDRSVVSTEAALVAAALRDLTGEVGAQGTSSTVGPPGQALATGVGLALAERLLAARFGKSLVDHRTWVIAADADLMGGIGHEAAGLAGGLKLGRVGVLWAAPMAAGAGPLAEDVPKRFAAYGWAVRRVRANDPAAIGAALSFALRARKPTLIACAAVADDRLGGPTRPVAPDWVAEPWRAAGARGGGARRGWLKRAARHPMRTEFARVTAGQLPEAIGEAFARLKAELGETGAAAAPRDAGERILAALAPLLPELMAGAAPGTDLGSAAVATVTTGKFRGRRLSLGIREGGMAAAMNGIALHGGLIPCAATALACSDAIRPALRFAATSGKRVIHVLEHEPSGYAAGTAAHRPAGHLASLRAVPNLHVFRPADAIETVECWELALARAQGPSLLVLTREPLAALRSASARNLCARGGYVLAEAEGPRRATLIASGGEVAVAAAARRLLGTEGIAVAVVSLPCWELFARQPDGYRAGVLGAAPRIGVEAAAGFGWERWLGEDGWFAGAREAGGAAPLPAWPEIGENGAVTAEAVAAALMRLLRRDGSEETNAHVEQDRHQRLRAHWAPGAARVDREPAG